MIQTILKAILICLLFLIVTDMSAQENIKVKSKHDNYIYENQVYEFKELEHIIAKNPEAYKFYKSSNTHGKTVYIYGLSLIASSYIGYEMLSQPNGPPPMYCDTYCFNYSAANVIGFLTLVSAIPTFLSLGIVSGTKKFTHKKKAIRLFNQNTTIGELLSREEGWTLRFDTTNNGVGLVLTF